MRPVAAKFSTSQAFGSMPTAGVAPSWVPNTVGWYVRLYGNYQPFGHAGEDIACPVGTPVYAIADGEVVWADWGYNLPGDDSDWGYRQRWYFYKGFPGILTVIKHPQLGPNVYTAYAHLSDNDMAPVGTKVKRGQLIALSGNTGGVAAHLHTEYLVDPSYRTGGGLIYGRDNPAKLYGALAPQASVVTPVRRPVVRKKDPEVPQFTRFSIPPARRRLSAGKTWYLKDKTGKANLNLAGGTGGLGNYDMALFLQGDSLPVGEVITVQFFIVSKGKRSGYWTQEIHGTKSGRYRASVPFKMPLTKSAAIEVAVTSSVESAFLSTYGADVYRYDLK